MKLVSALVLMAIITSPFSHAGNVFRYKLPKDIYESKMPKSCADLLAKNPDAQSGWETIFPMGLNGSSQEVFCDQKTDGGGWTRILYVGVNKQNCAGSMSLNSSGYCVKSSNAISFSANTLGLKFQEVRGGVAVFQSGSNDGFRRYNSTSSIDANYVDGVSFTYDDEGSRGHLFTYAIGQSSTSNRQACPSNGGDAPPSFVAGYYACETGNTGGADIYGFYQTELFGGIEFSRVLPTAMKTSLEVRVMNDQGTGDENIALNSIYIFIR